MLPDIFCGVQAVIVGCCMVLCMLTGSRVTWTSLFFSDLHMYLIVLVFDLYLLYFLVYGFLGHDFLEGLRPQHPPCLHSLDVPFQ